ncbi:MAG: 16S rRNA (uracil(1498)-N(3))-methyltransferase [Defluviitaleaceae bacterium]|nr:16S rRNA (uracil(1498)-N(3))-methyltransferase [Defluviitaleaceae bacterium]
MTRFFTDATIGVGGKLAISGEDFDHLRVLRPKIGETLELCNSEKRIVYTAEITDMSRADAQVTIVSKKKADAEPGCRITLMQAVPKFDKMELIIQKCVELGVSEIVPVLTNRTQTHPANAAVKAHRWQKISKEAAQQSGRDIIPAITSVLPFREALDSLSQYEHTFVANENETEQYARAAYQRASVQNVAIFIGPEGGFDKSEIKAMRDKGVESVSLGRRILRVETAAITAVILFLCAREEL